MSSDDNVAGHHVMQEKGECPLTYHYVNKNAQSNGDHEVHATGCSFMPASENRVYLGDFTSCKPAVTEAKRHYSQSNGCFYCCSACHTQ